MYPKDTEIVLNSIWSHLPVDALCITSFRMIPKEYFYPKKDSYFYEKLNIFLKFFLITEALVDVLAFLAILMNP